jgi:release factor family 3
VTPAALAPAPLPRHTDPLPLPIPAEVVALQSVRAQPAVSVLCSTEPGPRMTIPDAGRLGDLVAEAQLRLIDELGAEASLPLRNRLRELAADATGRATRSAVALYVSAHTSSAWSLSVDLIDRVVVDPTFATRDLVRSLHRTPRHVVLVMTDREARLFDGLGDTLIPALSGHFPLRRADRVTSRERAGRSERGDRVERRGETGDAARDAWLRIVDRALGSYLRLHPAPLVLVGTERLLARYTPLSRATGRLAGTITGSHSRTPLPTLAALTRPVLDRYLRSRQDEALHLLEERRGAGRAVSGMRAVWLAARAERPEMLAVEQGLFYPARLSGNGDLLQPASDVEHPDVIDDVVDEVIETVLQRGGWVALVDDGALEAEERIALTVRRG